MFTTGTFSFFSTAQPLRTTAHPAALSRKITLESSFFSFSVLFLLAVAGMVISS
jgi:hypothetical protein